MSKDNQALNLKVYFENGASISTHFDNIDLSFPQLLKLIFLDMVWATAKAKLWYKSCVFVGSLKEYWQKIRAIFGAIRPKM